MAISILRAKAHTKRFS